VPHTVRRTRARSDWVRLPPIRDRDLYYITAPIYISDTDCATQHARCGSGQATRSRADRGHRAHNDTRCIVLLGLSPSRRWAMRELPLGQPRDETFRTGWSAFLSDWICRQGAVQLNLADRVWNGCWMPLVDDGGSQKKPATAVKRCPWRRSIVDDDDEDMTEALLLMDIQNGAVERFAAGDEYLDRVVAAQAKAENAGLLVVLVRVAFNPGHPEISMRNKTFSAFKESDSMLLGSESTEPHPRLIRGKGEAIVTKKRISAFAGSDLALILRAHDVGHLLVAGIATSGVVLSTVREAADLDYRLTVLADICLDDDDEVHRVLTQKVFPRQADVISSSDWRPAGA
jgi:nicotinamidase-related amidase